MSVINIHGDSVQNDMLESLAFITALVRDGRISGLVLVAVGPQHGAPRAHFVTQGDMDHCIGQMERIKALSLLQV